MFCSCVCKSASVLSSLAMRAFSSSTESFSDCICPDTASILPLTASLCAFSFCCRLFTAAVIWLASSAVCSARCCNTPKRASSVDCSRCTLSSNCCTWVCSSTISFEVACAGAVVATKRRPNDAAASRRLRITPEFCILRPSYKSDVGMSGQLLQSAAHIVARCSCPSGSEERLDRPLHYLTGRSRIRPCGSSASTPRSTPCRTVSPCRS